VYALANNNQGQILFVLSFKVLGLEVIDERRLNNERPSKFFIPIPISPLQDNLQVAKCYLSSLFCFLTSDDDFVKLWTYESPKGESDG
jgi:hypothetical protein